ncbi:MAG: TRAP transporter substrate-binding protein [Synechococcaceae cyanobacterium RL_1_2]|nr:TRAP transporter substrate-binding protein [Synechococcaceae cyanobacterium RL_1_2]
MQRRDLLRNFAISAGTATVVSACQNATNAPRVEADDLPKLNWKMATSWPKSLETIFGGAQTVADRVGAMTGGKFTIECYQADEIVPGLQVLDAVENATVQCGHTAGYYYAGKNPALNFATGIPFGLNAAQQNAWLYQGGGLELMQKVYGEFNIINFPAGNTGGQMGGWFKKEIKTVQDLQGLKMRIPGFGGEVMSQLGVNVQVLPGGEIYLALERGAIDAAEWIGPYDDEKLGLNKAASYYYYPGWWEPGPSLDLIINLEAWAQLPPVYQEIVKTAALESNINMLARYNSLNGEALKRLVDSGTTLAIYSDEIMAAAKKITEDILTKNAASSPQFKEIYAQWSQFKATVSNWNNINELSLARFNSGQ